MSEKIAHCTKVKILLLQIDKHHMNPDEVKDKREGIKPEADLPEYERGSNCIFHSFMSPGITVQLQLNPDDL